MTLPDYIMVAAYLLAGVLLCLGTQWAYCRVRWQVIPWIADRTWRARRYVCSFCSKRFNFSTTLYSSISATPTGVVYQCPACNRWTSLGVKVGTRVD